METKNRKQSVGVRIALDVLMLLLAATMFNRNAISQLYHEIAGFALIALFIVHLILNRRTLAAYAQKRNVGAKRLQFMRVLDILLCVAWFAVLVTSVLVSKEIFPFGMRSLHPWHKFASAIAFLLTGVHFGLHWSYFWGMIRKAIANPKAIAAILLVFVLIFGCYCLCTSSYLRWISAPFTSRQMRGDGQRGMRSGEWGENAPWGNGENRRWGNRGENDENAPWDNGEITPRHKAAEGENESAPAENMPQNANAGTAPEQWGNGERPERPSRGDGEDGEQGGRHRGGRRSWGSDGEQDGEFRGWGGRRGRNRGDGEQNGEFGGEDRGRGRGNRRGNGDRFARQSFSLIRFFGSFVKGLGILLFFGAVTHGVDLLLCRKKKESAAAGETETPAADEKPKEPEETE